MTDDIDNDGTTLHESGGVVQPTDAQIDAVIAAQGGWSPFDSGDLHSFARAVLALAVPQAPLQAEPVPVVASEPSRSTWAADPWSAGTPVCKHCGRVLSLHESQRYCPTPQAEPAVAEQARVPVELLQRVADRLSKAQIFGMATELRAALASQSTPPPIDMVLHCPACRLQHIDAPDERTPDWKNEPHRSHLCHGCGHIWRPADVPTNGVQATATKGKADSTPPPESAGLTDEEIDRVRCNLNLPQSSDSEYVNWSKSELRVFARAILSANPTAQPDGGSKA